MIKSSNFSVVGASHPVPPRRLPVAFGRVFARFCSPVVLEARKELLSFVLGKTFLGGKRKIRLEIVW